MNQKDEIILEDIAQTAEPAPEEKKNGNREKGLFIPATVLTVIATVLAIFYGYFVCANIELALRMQAESGLEGVAFIVLLPLLLIFLVAMGVVAVIGLCFSISVVKLAVARLRKLGILYLVLDAVYIVGGIISFLITIGIISA